MGVQLNFRVSLQKDEDARDGNSIFVTGDLPVLGNWQPKDSLRLNQADDGAWSVSVHATAPVSDLQPYPKDQTKRRRVGQSVEYRYFVGKAFKDGRVCVKRWESSREPRRVVMDEEGADCEDTFGLGQQGGQLVRCWRYMHAFPVKRSFSNEKFL